jgi:hypothetical protein
MYMLHALDWAVSKKFVIIADLLNLYFLGNCY